MQGGKQVNEAKFSKTLRKKTMGIIISPTCTIFLFQNTFNRHVINTCSTMLINSVCCSEDSCETRNLLRTSPGNTRYHGPIRPPSRRLNSNQGSEYIAIFISLISGLQGQNLKTKMWLLVKNYLLTSKLIFRYQLF